jgi:hypothetical protein
MSTPAEQCGGGGNADQIFHNLLDWIWRGCKVIGGSSPDVHERDFHERANTIAGRVAKKSGGIVHR